MTEYPVACVVDIMEPGCELLDALPPCPQRSQTRNLIRAANDLQAVQCFLRKHERSPNTYRTYLREMERLVLWCVYVARKGFHELDSEDIEELFDFYADPPAAWIANNRAPRRTDGWRPFRGPLRGASLVHSRLILRSLFDYLLEARYIDGNPIALVRSPLPTAAHRDDGNDPWESAERCQLPQEALELCFEVADGWIAEGLVAKGLRVRFMFLFYLHTGARRMELAETSVGNIYEVQGRWWMRTIGKGGKRTRLPLSGSVIEALAKLRQHYGLPPYPTPGEQRPLFARLQAVEQPISGNMVYRALKLLFRDAAKLAGERGLLTAERLLSQASNHWLRHTTIGRAVSVTKDLKFGQQIGRHKSIETTAGYANYEDDDFHDRMTQVVEVEFGAGEDGTNPK